MLISMKNNNVNKNKILLLSATITDKILCFKPFGVVFGFYNDVIHFKNWIRRKITNTPQHTNMQRDRINSVMAAMGYNGLAPKPTRKKNVSFFEPISTYKNKGIVDDDMMLKIINNAVFPQYGSRIRIKELGDMFPQNQVTAQLY